MVTKKVGAVRRARRARHPERPRARQMQKQKDVDAWETNRMLTSGVAQRRDHGAGL